MKIRNKAEDLLTQIILENHDEKSFRGTLSFDRDKVATVTQVRVAEEAFVHRLRQINPDVKIIHVSGRGGVGYIGRFHCHFIIRGVTENDIKSAWEWGDVTACQPHIHKQSPDLHAFAGYYCSHRLEEHPKRTFYASPNHTVNGKTYGEI